MYNSRFFNNAEEDLIIRISREYYKLLQDIADEVDDGVYSLCDITYSHNNEVIDFFKKCYAMIGDDLENIFTTTGYRECDDFEDDLLEYLGIYTV